ncbi:hypothetical protein LKL35_05575 [Streptomyces sp. ET3-23]|uniref:hypothetical protein n=1 Tax=Streptomyces sp. ET3-23 TaxID=2885643 RepID=UPI001D122B8C|nr:hypothetical protein [Streptomyces sp. ET3-23]MCC2274906.1 hypothetical protein [Streptomyces sp. ET3-23]
MTQEGAKGVGARFPMVMKLGSVSTEEWQALRSLNRAYVDLSQEWESARAVAGGLMAKVELTEDYTQQGPYRHHLWAVNEACSKAIAYEEQIGVIAWRYASAAAVLGMTVLDRLMCGWPPLSPESVEQLAGEEPTLGRLREICSAPYDRLIATLEDDGAAAAADREALLGGLDAAYYNVTHGDPDIDGRRLVEAEADTCQLSTASLEGSDPLWEGLLSPVLNLAESLPYKIAKWVGRDG